MQFIAKKCYNQILLIKIFLYFFISIIQALILVMNVSSNENKFGFKNFTNLNVNLAV